MTTNERPRTGDLPVDPDTKAEEGAPATQAETRRPGGDLPDADIVTESDGSGASGGASGGSGGGSGMPGHPDATR
ncbi:preprotein translocase YidC [Actinoplanes teichomyceticus]|nr:preprotein translocase YidC [Actinoplanes teichomyceticus]